MARVFITGWADGLGQLAAKRLVRDGHTVVLHARNEARGVAAMEAVPGAEAVVTGDLSVIAETVRVAERVNESGSFDAIIHNAAVGYRESRRIATPDGLPQLFAVNSLAPYILTCVIKRPQRLVYLSSGLHTGGDASLQDLLWEARPWQGMNAYADSKLHDLLLAFAVARRWPDVFSNAVHPGWVPTKMGGAGATESLEKGAETQAWLGAGQDAATRVSGQYFYHQKPRDFLPAAAEREVQDRFLAECSRLSGIAFPA